MLAPPTLDVAAHHIAAALRHPPEPDREEYSRFRAGLEAVTDLGRDVLAADLGGGVGADGTTRAELAEAVGVGSSRALGRLFDALVDILLGEGYVTDDGGRLHRTERLDALDTSADAVSHRAATVTQRYAQVSDYLSLLVAAQQNLRPVLSGAKQGVDLLMPGGSMNLVEDLYKKNVQADFYNALVGECVSERARRYARRYPHSTLQVLEAGAGTGATADVLLRGLEPQADRVQYYFTDIGDFFVAQARRRYADRRNVRFCVHDIERPAEEQGIEPHSMDLVVASSVLHATRDVGRTLRSCARLLKAGGALVINELVHRMDYNTLTFGLTEGWWLFEDPQRRIPGSPLLTAAAWREALREAGFCHVEVSGVPGVPEGEQAQCVIVAARGEAGALDD